MKKAQSTQELKSSTQASHESQGEQKNVQQIEAPPPPPPIQESGSGSGSSNESKKVSRQDIELVQNLIERCLQLYMNRDEVVKTLLTRARIDPGFTTLVWQKLEEENADFFRAYYIRLKVKKQIIVFNNLLEHQYNLMKYPPPPPPVHSKLPLVPMQNGIHPMVPVTNMPMGYPILPHPHMHSPMGRGISSCHVVNGIPAPANLQPRRINTANNNDMVVDTTTVAEPTVAEPTPVIPPNNGGEMQVSPTSVASSGHFPFAATDMSGMEIDTSALDSAFTTDVGTSGGLQLGSDEAGSSRDNEPFDQITWNFSLSDLTADLSNLGDLGALGNYPGSPFLPSDSDILLDSPEPDDIDEFFVDSLPDLPGSQSDEEKP